jgi:DNA repair protein RadA/Sms
VARPQSRYVCQACGASSTRFEGRCHVCGAWETLVETLIRDEPRVRRGARAGPSASSRAASAGPVPLGRLEDQPLLRRPVGIAEFDRVLGGGLVPGSLVLLGGEPGIGKSTLALEAAAGLAGLAGAAEHVLYVSGEESPGQLRLRAARLGLTGGPAAAAIEVLAETDLERVVEEATARQPALVVVDSIQTLTVDGLDGPAGSVGQVREAAGRLLGWAKGEGIPVLLVGHVTKDGSLAGPKALEHLVDAVLTLEGERIGQLRLLRATKNRFGSTDEIGVFEMAPEGLREVPDPTRAFLGEGSAAAPGSVVAATLEGRRPLLIEVQALVAPAAYPPPRRTVGGLDANRLALLIAVLGKRAGLGLGSHDVYASLAGGLTVSEPAIDLPLALALASSLRDRPVDRHTVVCGEVGLLGELRGVAGLESRLGEAERLGFRRAIVPATSRRNVAAGSPRPGGPVPAGATGAALEIVAVGTLREAIAAALGPVAGASSEASPSGRRAVPVGPG